MAEAISLSALGLDTDLSPLDSLTGVTYDLAVLARLTLAYTTYTQPAE